MAKTPECHPERTHLARGMCGACYRSWWRAENPDRYHEAHREGQRRRYRRNSTRHRGRNRERLYGITPEEYQALLVKQGGVCAICWKPETTTQYGKTPDLSVDHDHETGRVRGLLCHACNRGMGLMNDDPGRLRAAADYLEHASCRMQEAS